MEREGSTQGKGLARAGAVRAPAGRCGSGRARALQGAGAASYAGGGFAHLHWAGAKAGSRVPFVAVLKTRHVGRTVMKAMRIVGVLLLVLGLAGFLTGGFSFTKDTTQAKLGPLELTVKEKESVNIPQWMSLGAMVLGGVVLVLGFRKN